MLPSPSSATTRVGPATSSLPPGLIDHRSLSKSFCTGIQKKSEGEEEQGQGQVEGEAQAAGQGDVGGEEGEESVVEGCEQGGGGGDQQSLRLSDIQEQLEE